MSGDGASGGAPRTDDGLRQESEGEREDRRLGELLQELRVAGLGVQVLFGFLLGLPFTVRFSRVDAAQRHLYLGTLLTAAAAVALLCAPVAYHRLVFRRHMKGRLLRTANVLAVVGMVAVALAVSGAVALVTSVVSPGAGTVAVTAGTLAGFGVLWFALPLVARRSAPLRAPPDPPAH